MEGRPGSSVTPSSSRHVLRRSSDPALDENRNRTRGDQHSSRQHAFSLWPRPDSPRRAPAAKTMASTHMAAPPNDNPSPFPTSDRPETHVHDSAISSGSSSSAPLSEDIDPRETRAGGIMGYGVGAARKALHSTKKQSTSGATRTTLQPQRTTSADTVVLMDSVAPAPSVPRTKNASQAAIGMPSIVPSTTARSSLSQQTAQSRFNSVGSGSDSTNPGSRDRKSSVTSSSYETDATSINTLPALQPKGPGYELGQLQPVPEDDPTSYDLIAPVASTATQRPPVYSLENRSDEIFSTDHLRAIFDDPASLLKFTSFLGSYRPESVPMLIYYLDSLKALRAVRYANAVSEALEPLEGHAFTEQPPPATRNPALEEKARMSFQAMVDQDLPAFVTHTWISVVSASIHRRVTGTMPPHLREASEGLAEVFCLSDPSRPDNPIIMASEEFHRITQYGSSYAMGRNCRFLQGPRTDRGSIRRLRQAVDAGKEHCEVFVNYRRDGSPFMNLLMMAPLRDSRGTLRYYIGAQVDVSGLAKECAGLDALQKMLSIDSTEDEDFEDKERKDEFQELSEMLNLSELEIVRKYGGRMHREHEEREDTATTWHRPRLLLKDPSAERIEAQAQQQASAYTVPTGKTSGKLGGIYQHYLLVRPYPSLRILFASPSLRVPGILQSPFMNRIGGSERVRDELVAALAEGRGVTAKVRWLTRAEDEGRNRWVHCTPLMGSNGHIGVWMVVLVDEENSRAVRRFRPAPPVSIDIGGKHYDPLSHRKGSAGSDYRVGSATGHRSGTAQSQRGGSRQDGSFDFTIN